jgi:hypothetical protein
MPPVIFFNVPIEFVVQGLTPGTKYCASLQFHPDDGGTGGVNLGMSQQAVKANGTITFDNDVSDVSPEGKPGTLTAWLRPGSADGGDFADPPVVVDGVTLEQITHIP